METSTSRLIVDRKMAGGYVRSRVRVFAGYAVCAIRSRDCVMGSAVEASKTLCKAFCCGGVLLAMVRLFDDSGDLCFEQIVNTIYCVYGVRPTQYIVGVEK